MRRLFPFALFSLLAVAGSVHGRVLVFDEPVDAVSLGLGDAAYATIRADDGEWTTVYVENEQDPLLRESNLTVFDAPVTRIAIRHATESDVHPIRVAKDPAVRMVAATGDVGKKRILTRSEWGADDTLLYTVPKANGSSSSTAEKSESGGAEPSNRIKDCMQAQEDYPEEFRVARTEKTSADGKTYLWPVQYSPEVKLLAVHHTAIQVGSDPRSAVERVRALYQFHAVNRGWGDIGYNYIIDEAGEIYEGRHGGDFAVAGHAYCNNVGTLGVALLGNFELEQPTQEQMQALQWLLTNLAERYNIPLDRKIRFHGKSLPTVVGHKDLVSTECPGYYAYNVLAQVREHVANGDVAALINFPNIAKNTEKIEKKTEERKAKRVEERVAGGRSTGPIDRRLAIKLKSQSVTALRRTLRNRVQESGSTARPTSTVTGRVVYTPKSSSSSALSVSPGSSAGDTIRIRLTAKDAGLGSCADAKLDLLRTQYRGELECITVDGAPAIINTVELEDYMAGLAEEPDTEPYEKQRAFAIAARSYAVHYMDPANRKFPGKPYDGSDSPATFQKYGGIAFETGHPRWVEAVRDTEGKVLTVNGEVLKTPYFSSDDGRTRSPQEAGWANFPHAGVFASKDDSWCKGMPMAGHGVGMSGCGSEAQANEGKTAEEILGYYYPGTTITTR